MSITSSEQEVNEPDDTPRKAALKRKNLELDKQNKQIKLNAKRSIHDIEVIREKVYNENLDLESELHSSRKLFADALEEKQKCIDSVRKELTESVEDLEIEKSLHKEEKANLKSSKDRISKKFAATRRHLVHSSEKNFYRYVI